MSKKKMFGCLAFTVLALMGTALPTTPEPTKAAECAPFISCVTAEDWICIIREEPPDFRINMCNWVGTWPEYAHCELPE